jgi:hypothetical protein
MLSKIMTRKKMRKTVLGRLLAGRNLSFYCNRIFDDGSMIHLKVVCEVVLVEHHRVYVHISDILSAASNCTLYPLYVYFIDSRQAIVKETHKELHRVIGQYLPKQAIKAHVSWRQMEDEYGT